MRVLVSGGAGYIGSAITAELTERGHNPVVFDALYWGKQGLEEIESKIEIIEGDCRNSRDVIYALQDIDAVIHLAGIVGAPACSKNPKAHFSVNIESTRTLINCCTDPEMDLVRDFLFASSCSVYGNVKGMYDEVKETTPVNPLSTYAHAKLRSEDIILKRGQEVTHFHPTILRLTTVFGWSQRPRLDLVTNLFAYKGWKEKKITVHGGGMQYRSLIHIKDIACAFVDTLESERFKRDGQIFHVGEETNNKTIWDIAQAVKNNIPDVKISNTESANSDARDYRINCQKIKNTIGWYAKYSMEDGIEELIEKFNSLDLDWENPLFRNSSWEYV
jgi:nucleoside-diphosphate-sugar epimerase